MSVEQVWLGNGVSELITLSLQALINDGDEILIPAPDYPLWTASTTSLSGGRAVHYLCDEAEGWLPDVEDLARRFPHELRRLSSSIPTIRPAPYTPGGY